MKSVNLLLSGEIEDRLHNIESQMADQLNVIKTMILNIEDKLAQQDSQYRRANRKLHGAVAELSESVQSCTSLHNSGIFFLDFEIFQMFIAIFHKHQPVSTLEIFLNREIQESRKVQDLIIVEKQKLFSQITKIYFRFLLIASNSIHVQTSQATPTSHFKQAPVSSFYSSPLT